MKLSINKILYGVLLFLIAVPSDIATAQDYVFRHLTTRSGLAGGYVNKIVQDDRGFIWFATTSGLSKYDGFTFKNYRSESNLFNSITDSYITDLLLLPEDHLLISHAQGIDLLDMATDQFKQLSFKKSGEAQRMERMMLDENGDLWTIDFSTNLYHFPQPNYDSDSLTSNIFSTDMGGAENFRDFEWYRGEIWIGTNNGILVFNPTSRVFRQITSTDPTILEILDSINWDLQIGPDGNMYATFEGGLLRYNYTQKRLEHIERIGTLTLTEMQNATYQDMMVDSENHLWIGTSGYGAFRWNLFTDEFTEFRSDSRNEQTVNSSDIHTLFEDQQQNIWFGYHSLGSSIMYSQSWNYKFSIPYPDLSQEAPENVIMGTRMDEKSIIWAATRKGLIRSLGSPEQQLFEYPDGTLDLNNGATIHGFGDDEVILSHNQEIVVFNNRENTFKYYPVEDGLGVIPVNDTEYGSNIFVGTDRLNKLLVFNRESLELEVLDIGSASDTSAINLTLPTFVYEDELYILILSAELGFANGKLNLYRYNLVNGEVSESNADVEISLNGISPPLFSKYTPEISFFPVNAGLIRINALTEEVILLFEDEMPILREGTGLLTEDEQGYLWSDNQTGLMQADPLTESISYFEIPVDKKPLSYFSNTTLTNGEIIIAGIGGYVQFNPAELEAEQPVEKTIITSLLTSNNRYNTIYEDKTYQIESSDNNLTLNFIGMNFRDPSSTHYRYRILGSDNEQWNNVGTQRSVFIPNLSSGTYTFEVQSGSQFGSFDEKSARLSVTILSPWWNSYPAYFAYLLILGALVFGVDRVQRRRLLYKEKERNREKELKQAREIETAYHDLEQAHEQLKSAQVQLVQQEKLASLGQLTAGIAHEIKNPLNFVNNFSELSMEMIQESKENLETIKGQLKEEDHKYVQETLEALENVEHNLKKIHKHGSRADRIVKSMLQHSRGGSGDKTPTDLNDLLREYVNLAFHGMRAGKKPINVDIKLQLEDNLPELPIISEDFSRVIVNLCNNAFDAMRVKLEGSNPDDYKPVLTVRSHSSNEQVILEFEDNGPGISEEHKDKVLQPFFTTKKGTEGTGLGLSITHDIIKAHGGTMDIETKEDKFTIFKVYLNK